MARLRESTTAVVWRGETWEGEFATEPYECGWAIEAVLFLRLLERAGPGGGEVRVQISPDGMNWAEEGTPLVLPEAGTPVTFAKLRHFGNWVRVAGTLPDGATCKVIATLHFKG